MLMNGIEVLCYAQTVEGDRPAYCGALDPEQCGAPRSVQDSLNRSKVCNSQGNRYTGTDKRAGVCRSHQPQAGLSLSEGFSQASDSSGGGVGSLQTPTTRPGPLATVQDDEAVTTVSGGSSSGSAKEGHKVGTAEASAGEPPQRRRGKRKLPVPDLDAIEDPVELRLQRRLLKNRRTAAASRERKQKEMDSLVAHVRALEEDNEKLRQALRQRNAQISMLRTPAPPRREIALAATLAPLPRPAAPAAAAPVFLGNLPLHRGFHASPQQEPLQAAGSPGQLAAARPWMFSSQLVMQTVRSEPPWHGVGAPPWGAAGVSRLRGGLAAPGPSTGGCADAPVLGQPPPSSLSAAEFNLTWSRSLSTSGLAAVPHPSLDRHCSSQPLHLAPSSSRAHPVHDLDNPSPFGGPSRAMLRVRANSCSDLPPVGLSVGPAGGTCPSGLQLQSRSGSYPQVPRHVPAHADNHAATSATDVSFLLPPADPDDPEQMDFYNFWRGLA